MRNSIIINVHTYKEDEIEVETQSNNQAIASNFESKREKDDGQLSDDEEVVDEFEEERGLVDGKIRRDDEYDEDYAGIQIDESVTLKRCCLPFCPDCRYMYKILLIVPLPKASK